MFSSEFIIEKRCLQRAGQNLETQMIASIQTKLNPDFIHQKTPAYSMYATFKGDEILMSLATYIGTNVEIPTVNECEDYDQSFFVGDCFTNEYIKKDVMKYHFSTTYIYEVSSHWGIEISSSVSAKVQEESKQKLEKLCRLMKSYIQPGDYFELISFWVGEERDKRNGEFTLTIEDLNIHAIEIPEKTLVRFQF